MEDLEKKIEEAAENFSVIKRGQIDSFIEGAKSPEAKEFHQQGMYSEEDLIDFSVWCGINYISYYSQRNNKRIWFDPDNVKYLTTEKLLDIWKEQNKKK